MKPIRSTKFGRSAWALIAIVALIIAAHVWIDRLYALREHVALGYGAVYSVNMTFELLTRYIGALVYLLLGLVAVRPFRTLAPPAAYRAIKLVGAVLGWIIGYGLWALSATNWLLLFHHQGFPKSDPIFHLNYAFYVFQLPLLLGLVGRITTTVVLLIVVRLVVILAVYAKQQLITADAGLTPMMRRQLRVVVASGAALFLCFTALSVLDRYGMALSQGNGSFIYGPDFVSARLTIPVFSWLQVLALLLTTIALAVCAVKVDSLLRIRDGFTGLHWRALRRPVAAIGVYIALLVVSAGTGAAVNGLYVHPNQNTVELPYIKNTIDATRWALGIENIQTQAFNPAESLTADAVVKDKDSLANVRVNDQGQTTTIYNQLQSFKSYFQFTPATVDRYDGNEVYVSARQMAVDKLPVQTWVNRTLVYTHGYGLAASPVNQFDADGLPLMWAKNTPQETVPPLPQITRPEIYFGTVDNNVIAPSKQAEFDYPVGSQDHSSRYQGGYGLPIAGNRWLLMLEQGSLKFYTSDQITAKSQWLFDRNIYNRVQDIAPFLTYDNDVFPFIDDSGHVQWMLDAYTETDRIPYAQSFLNTAYIRNSVKVVMDAYTGKTTFYVVDKSDPLVQSYMQLYPSLFTTNIPADVSRHFRYPTDLFQAQATALTRYHMTDPAAFYNQEDLWGVAEQIYQQNNPQPRPPVYQMVRMPDRNNAQFVLSSLFTPANKDNLNGWFTADNEPGQYGKLTVYQFPQSSLTFGPMQAENQIDSDPTISSQLTLWNQQGSHVVRGDLLLIPVGNSILYVEPVYIVANRDNSLPQLERVIVDYNKQVVMDNSLGAAIQDLMGRTTGEGTQPNTPPGPGAGAQAPGAGASGSTQTTAMAALAAQANQLLQQYETDTAKGNFEAAGRDLRQLQQVLTQLTTTAQGSKK